MNKTKNFVIAGQIGLFGLGISALFIMCTWLIIGTGSKPTNTNFEVYWWVIMVVFVVSWALVMTELFIVNQYAAKIDRLDELIQEKEKQWDLYKKAEKYLAMAALKFYKSEEDDEQDTGSSQ